MGGSLGLAAGPAYLASARPMKDPVSKNKTESVRERERETPEADLWHPHTHEPMCTVSAFTHALLHTTSRLHTHEQKSRLSGHFLPNHPAP